MRYIAPQAWAREVSLLTAAAALAGACDPLWRIAARSGGFSEASGSRFNILVLSVLVVASIARFPRARFVLPAALAATLVYSLMIVFAYGVVLRRWSVPSLAIDVASVVWALPPIYCLLAVPVTLIAQRYRRVGFPPMGVCQTCGYSLRGLSTPRCPECGEPFGPQDKSAPG